MTQMELKVRPFRASDVSIGFNETLSVLSPTNLTEVKAQKWFMERKKQGIKTLVVETERQIVGTGSIWIERKLCYDGAKAAHIEDVAVHSEWQGQGVGKLIVNKLIETAEKAKVYKIVLDSSDKNVEFYRKLGFYLNCNCLRKDIIS